MLKPSDFNNAVPQFQNGNYASNPINPQYVEEPSSTDYNRGTEPLQTLPAQWWNWFMNKFTSRFNKVNIYVKNLFNELAQLLSLVNVTPDGTEGDVTDGQLKNAFKELYPNYINTKLALESTYVKKTQKVNNHALSGDVTVTKSDVGLGSVVNTGDSATPVENGTTKFTTGGAYTLKKDLTDIAESLPTDAVLHYSFDDIPDYPDGTADVRLIDNNTYQIQSTDAKFRNNGGSTFTDSNGNLQVQIIGGSGTGVAIASSAIYQKVIKLKIKVTQIVGELRIIRGNVRYATITNVGEYELTQYVDTSTYLYFYCLDAGNSCTFIVEKIYIGEGSYSTPIIDNANGQNNATNNGGIAVQGVSGKGAYFLNGKYANADADFQFTENFSCSIWCRPEDFSSNCHIVRKQGVMTLVISSGILRVYLYDNNGNDLLNSFELSPMTINQFTHIVIVRNGLSFKYYKNGVLTKSATLSSATIQKNNNDLTVGSDVTNVAHTEDDLLIFDRALTEDEVTALYLNKANTPKYYGEVPVTRKVNGYTLDKDITLAKSDVGLGSVVNTGDSAIPVSGGTTKFTTGGAYNLLTSLAPIFSTLTSYALGDMVTYNGVLYTCITAHSAGAWNASHFTAANLNTEFQKTANNIAVNFTTGRSYSKGELVIYGKELYRCKNHTYTHVSAWDPSIFEKTNLVNTEQKYPGLYVLNIGANVSTVVELPELPAGSELIIRMDNESSSNRTVTLKATKKYVLGILGGLTSAVRTLQVNETYAQEVYSGGYIEVHINYIEVDDHTGFMNDSLLTFPLPTVNDYYV